METGPSYRIIFNDGEYWYNESLSGEWNSMPKKPIQSLSYCFHDKLIHLSGFDGYNHLVERVAFMNGPSVVNKYILMARIGERVDILELNPVTKKIDKKISTFGCEYNNKKTNGWKDGEQSNMPSIYIK